MPRGIYTFINLGSGMASMEETYELFNHEDKLLDSSKDPPKNLPKSCLASQNLFRRPNEATITGR
jgi:hypothetical protein